MKLVAEAGGTKIDWMIINNQSKFNFSSVGYNPLQNDSNYLRQILISNFPKQFCISDITQIEYFGTGCANNTGKERVKKSLSVFFTNAKTINIYTDLTAVGKAVFNNNSGIVGILGTGASVGFYNKEDICIPIPSLGYILGDEGSGAWLGKELIKKTLRQQLPTEIIRQFFDKYNITQEKIIENTYSAPTSSKYIASFTPFIKDNIETKEINDIVISGFKLFIKEHLTPIHQQYHNEPIAISGGIAYNFKDILTKEIQKTISMPVQIIKSPLEGIINSI